MVSWWDVFQAIADGTSIVPSCLWRIRDRSHGDLAEGRLEGEGACPPPLDAGAAFAVPLLQDQFLVGLLDEDLEDVHSGGLVCPATASDGKAPNSKGRDRL